VVRNLSSWKKEISLMLKYYVEASDMLKRLRTDKDGVVSLEYVVVAACVVTVVIAAYSTGGSLPGALTTGFTAITTAMAGI
jgi:Flp pilus assembly pilin Flp